jgi:hypothetical protein
VYDELSRQPHWSTVECWDASQQSLRSPQSIHEEIVAATQALIEARENDFHQGEATVRPQPPRKQCGFGR